MRQGSGDGCDYTIGCNKTFNKLKATTPEEAEAAAISILTPEEPEHWGWMEDTPQYIEKAIIVEVVGEVDVEAIYDAHRKAIKDRKDLEKNAKEKAEFKRLQKKFDGG